MPSRRKGSSNPDGYDDPDWYERPGETVLMDYKPQPGFHVAPRMPWNPEPGVGSLRHFTEVSGHPPVYTLEGTPAVCRVCGRSYRSMTLEHGAVMLCDYCARSHERYERHAERDGRPM